MPEASVFARTLFGLLLFSCIIPFVCTSTGFPKDLKAPASNVSTEAQQRNGFLYPVLVWGPNNQVAGLKEALVLGRLLQRTVVVHGIVPWDKTQNRTASQPKLLPFDLIYDYDHLARHQSIIRLDELRARGWDGRLQAVAYFERGPILKQIKHARALNVSDRGARYLDFRGFACAKPRNGLADMARRLAPHEYAGVILYENVVRGAAHDVALRPTGERCHDEYLQVSAQLVKSPRLVAMAAAFRARRLGGRPYVAVHVRPYPDKCLALWLAPTYDTQLAAAACRNPGLFASLVPRTRRALAAHGLDTLFVMCHPRLRQRVSQLYGEAGMTAVFYDEQDMEDELGYRSMSLLGMLEQELCFGADAFIGSATSSMTGMILQERHARGRREGTSAAFEEAT